MDHAGAVFQEILGWILLHPLSILAFALCLSGWLLWLRKSAGARRFLARLEALPVAKRESLCAAAGQSYRRLGQVRGPRKARYLARKQLLIANSLTLVSVVLVTAASLRVIGARGEAVPPREERSDHPPAGPRADGKARAAPLPLEFRALPAERPARKEVPRPVHAASPGDPALADRVRAERVGLQELLGAERRRAAHLRIRDDGSALEIALPPAAAPAIDARREALERLVLQYREGGAAGLATEAAREAALAEVVIETARPASNGARIARMMAAIPHPSPPDDGRSGLPAADVFEVRGNAYYRLGKWQAALASYQGALDLRADPAGLVWDTANLLARMGRGPEAVESLNGAIEGYRRTFEGSGDPKALRELSAALHGRAMILYLESRLEEAVRDCREALDGYARAAGKMGWGAVEQDIANALITRGVTLAAKGLPSRGIEDLETASRIHRRLALRMGGFLTDDLARAQLFHAAALASEGRWTEAIRGLTSLLASPKPPGDAARLDHRRLLAFAHVRRGHAHFRTRAYGNALADYEKAFELAPDLEHGQVGSEVLHYTALGLAHNAFAMQTNKEDAAARESAVTCHRRAIEAFSRLLEPPKEEAASSAAAEDAAAREMRERRRMALLLAARAMCRQALGEAEQAVSDYSQALARFSEPEEEDQDIRIVMALCLGNRSLARVPGLGKKPTKSRLSRDPVMTDLDRAVRLLDVPVCAVSQVPLGHLARELIDARTRVLGEDPQAAPQVQFLDAVEALYASHLQDPVGRLTGTSTSSSTWPSSRSRRERSSLLGRLDTPRTNEVMPCPRARFGKGSGEVRDLSSSMASALKNDIHQLREDKFTFTSSEVLSLVTDRVTDCWHDKLGEAIDGPSGAARVEKDPCLQ